MKHLQSHLLFSSRWDRQSCSIWQVEKQCTHFWEYFQTSAFFNNMNIMSNYIQMMSYCQSYLTSVSTLFLYTVYTTQVHYWNTGNSSSVILQGFFYFNLFTMQWGIIFSCSCICFFIEMWFNFEDLWLQRRFCSNMWLKCKITKKS